MKCFQLRSSLRRVPFLVATLVPPVVGRDPDADLRHFIVNYSTGRGGVSSGLGDRPKTDFHRDHGEDRTIVGSPFDLPRDGVLASQRNPPVVLCCGTKDPGQASDAGVIVQASIQLGQPHSVHFDSQVSLPGVDAGCMSWTPQLPVIFVLDKNTRQV
jgi:hypothetical protein